MFVTVIGRFLGAAGLLCLLLFSTLRFFVPDMPGLSWLGAAAAVGVSGWIYLDWDALVRLVSSRGGREQGGSLLLIALVGASCGLLLHLAERSPTRWDFTVDQRHSLSERAAGVVSALPDGVSIEVIGWFVGAGDARQQEQRASFDRLADAVAAVNPAVVFSTVDPQASPRRALEAGVTGNGTVTAIARSGEERRSEQLFSPDEGELVNALLRLGQDRKAAVYFVTGHGESAPGVTGRDGVGTLVAQMQAVGYRVESLETMRISAVPDDAELLVIADPKAALAPTEVAMIQGWVEAGGSLLLAVEPVLPGSIPRATGFEEVLPSWGVKLRADLVLDELMHSYSGDATSVISASFGYHDITDDLQVPTLFPTARSVADVNEDPEDVTVFELVRSSEMAWGETDLTGGAAVRGEDDTQGPLTLVTLSEIHREPGKDGRVLVAGDVDWLTDTALGNYGNGDLAQRAVAFLAKQADLVTIPPRDRSGEAMELDGLQAVAAIVAGVLVVPVGVLLLGVLVFVWRRSL